MLKIVADENLEYPLELFSQFGEVKLINGRKITNSVLKNADALIIRSVTEVNETLLSGTKIKFVGTATIGTDHIDYQYLKSREIVFASAPGCNSYAVAEYVLTSLLLLAVKAEFLLKDKTIGVVGIGNVGSKVVRFCEALGMKVLKNDPPLYRKGELDTSVQLNEILDADIVTIHVPLTFEGEDKTHYLFDLERLKRLKDKSILINTSRGSVINENALIDLIDKKNLSVISDVWENEPEINKKLMNKAAIGTPHIAGYSLEGKVNGTLMVYEALAEFLGKEKSINISLPPVVHNKLDFDFSENEEAALNKIIKNIYDIRSDYKRLLKINSYDSNDSGKYFDKLRKEYPLRREFNNYSVSMNKHDDRIKRMLIALRFAVNL
jgi:erythronate-4-phosphate dehydrogenase